MSDPLVPPPRRPAPAQLRERVLAELDRAPAHRVRPRYVVLPLAAAATVTAVAIGVSSLGSQSTIAPAQTASPAPTTSSAVAPTPAPTTKAPTSLDIRAMTKTEIAADTKSCRAVEKYDTDPVPQRGKPKVQFARVQLTAGLDGVSSRSVRMLITKDDAGAWVCENGVNTSWSSDGLAAPDPSRTVPAIEVPNYGGSSGSCDPDDLESTGTALYAVGDQVEVGRVRVVKGDKKGPWLTSTPHDGYVHFIFRVRGEDALAKNVSAQFQFLDAGGRPVTVQPYGPRGTKTATTGEAELSTCSDQPKRLKPKALSRPKSDEAGVATCLKMAKEAAELDDSKFGSGWRSRLVVSTADEWGAVLSNGSRRVGCSLFPTKEISPITTDSTKINKAAFAFALNPIALPEGESLWAAGRAPEDVIGISYTLPGSRVVPAQISSDGYWMVKAHADGTLGTADDVSTWDPVVVTVTRASRTETFTIPFGDTETMCHQISHGC